MSTHSIIEHGGNGIVAEIECRITQGLPAVIIVGFASKAVDEAKERIRGAFSTLPVDWPRQRIAINLAPADIPKQHTSFDLAIAMAILEANSSIPRVAQEVIYLGELGMDGSLRPVRGLIGKLLAAKDLGVQEVFVPAMQIQQAQLVGGLRIYPCNNLLEVFSHYHDKPITPLVSRAISHRRPTAHQDFADITGQNQAIRALTIAAAGRHNILLYGPPGTGKSMLAKALPSIMPPLSQNEILETTQLHSLVGSHYGHLVTTPPFRSPHHTASETAVIGRPGHPGEISLAHNGVLFLDELPEFKRNVIEALRQPLEDRRITLTRSKESITYPASCMLIATANPCPCGFMGSDRACRCSMTALQSYQKKLSGPIIDRIDLFVSVANIQHQKLLGSEDQAQSSEQLWRQVDHAIGKQYQRFKDVRYNSQLSNRQLKQVAAIRPEAKHTLNQGAKTLDLSPRGYMRTVKVARTIADLEGTAHIEVHHITEALQYRPNY